MAPSETEIHPTATTDASRGGPLPPITTAGTGARVAPYPVVEDDDDPEFNAEARERANELRKKNRKESSDSLQGSLVRIKSMKDDMGDSLKRAKIKVMERTESQKKKMKEDMKLSIKKSLNGKGGGHFTFNPRSSFFRYWDLLIAVLLLYTAVYTPYEVSFLDTKIDPSFFINRFVDLCFLSDMVFNFLLPIQDKNGVWISEGRKIASKYLQGWFAIDVVSVFPFELVGMLSDSDNTNDLKVLRIIRLLRLAKLLRVLRAGRVFQKWESTFSVDYAKIALIQFVVITVAVAHWLACAWHMCIVLEDNQNGIPGREPPELLNWLNSYDFSSMDASSGSKYIVSLYWSIATLSTLGYGDVVPTTDTERAFVIICAMLGASVYAYMIGNVCSIVAGMDEHNARFFQMMDSLNSFVDEKDLPQSLRVRLRDFFRFRRFNTNMQDWQGLMVNMSPQLRAEVSRHLHAKWIGKVQCFRGCSEAFIVAISMNLHTEAYGTKESIISTGSRASQMYIIERGVVYAGDQDRIVSNGGTIGEDMLFRTKSFVRMYNVNTLTNCVVMCLTSSVIVQVLDGFPVERKHLRRYVLKMVFRNTISAYVRTHRKIEARARAGKGLLSADIEKDIDANMLPILFETQMRMYGADKMARLVKSTITVQKYARRWILRDALKQLKRDVRAAKKDWTDLSRMLDRFRLSEHEAALRKARLTLSIIQDLSPGEVAMSGIPIGDAYRIVREVSVLSQGKEVGSRMGKGHGAGAGGGGSEVSRGLERSNTVAGGYGGGLATGDGGAEGAGVGSGLDRTPKGGAKKRHLRPGGKA